MKYLLLFLLLFGGCTFNRELFMSEPIFIVDKITVFENGIYVYDVRGEGIDGFTILLQFKSKEKYDIGDTISLNLKQKNSDQQK